MAQASPVVTQSPPYIKIPRVQVARPLSVWSSRCPEGTDLKKMLRLKELLGEGAGCHAGAPSDAASISLSGHADMDSMDSASAASLPLKPLCPSAHPHYQLLVPRHPLPGLHLAQSLGLANLHILPPCLQSSAQGRACGSNWANESLQARPCLRGERGHRDRAGPEQRCAGSPASMQSRRSRLHPGLLVGTANRFLSVLIKPSQVSDSEIKGPGQ